VIVLVSVVINMGYSFEGSFKRLERLSVFSRWRLTGEQTLDDVPAGRRNSFCRPHGWDSFHVPLPANYIQGIDTQRLDFERGMKSYVGRRVETSRLVVFTISLHLQQSSSGRVAPWLYWQSW